MQAHHPAERRLQRQQRAQRLPARLGSQAVRHPEHRRETAVVMRGDEGTGKGIFGRWMTAACSASTACRSPAPVHLVGRFNSAPSRTGGNRCSQTKPSLPATNNTRAVLKGIITEPTHGHRRQGPERRHRAEHAACDHGVKQPIGSFRHRVARGAISCWTCPTPDDGDIPYFKRDRAADAERRRSRDAA